MEELTSKWPAAKAFGPSVTVEQAREYILRTDGALAHPDYSCNDRRFLERLRRLIGYDTTDDWGLYKAYQRNYGHIELGHFDSHWVASSYIGGPNGLVGPTGDVSLAKNFGKWPSIEEIEHNLTKLATAFPWLTFTLVLWDGFEQTELTWGQMPTHAWHVTSGGFSQQDPAQAIEGARLPSEKSVESMVAGLITGLRRETTFTIEEIDAMWGDTLRTAYQKAKAGHAAEKTEGAQ